MQKFANRVVWNKQSCKMNSFDTAEDEPRQVSCTIRAPEKCSGIVSVIGRNNAAKPIKILRMRIGPNKAKWTRTKDGVSATGRQMRMAFDT